MMTSKLLRNSLLAAPALLGASLALSATALANETRTEGTILVPTVETAAPLEVAQALPTLSTDAVVAQPRVESVAQLDTSTLDQVRSYSREGQGQQGVGQVTSVTQLSDVQPTDWAFQALQSLVEKYGCIVGYPDGTFRGQRALTRYEFAAGLNACLDRVNELIAAATADLATKEDLAVLQKLQEEFAAELATLRGRVDNLEARTAQLEATQFSTTTKLRAEAIFGLSNAFGDGKAYPPLDQAADFGFQDSDLNRRSVNDNTVFSNRLRLGLATTFTGEDLLWTRLDAGNTNDFLRATGTPMATLSYAYDNGNDIQLGQLYYKFPIGDRIQMTIGTAGMDFDDISPTTFNPVYGDGTNAISRFADRNPFVYRAGTGSNAGAGVNFWFGKDRKVALTAAYLASDAGNPADKNGLFNGDNTIVGQLMFAPSESLELGFAYTHSYYPGGDLPGLSALTGSWNANAPFGRSATSMNTYNGMLNWRISPKFAFGGWVGFGDAHNQSGASRSADLWTWAAVLAFPDLGKEGNLGGLVIGMPPQVTSNDRGRFEDEDTSLHIEGFYKFQVNDFIAITPGVYVITNPNHNSNNDTVWVGTLRTTFQF